MEEVAGGAFVSRYINKPIARPLARILAKTPVTPNQITLLGLLVGLLAGYYYSMALYLQGALLLYLNSIIDGIDGEVAKLKGLRSPFGAFLSTLSDRLTDSAALLGLLWAQLENSLLVALSSLALVASLLHSYTSHLLTEVGLGARASKSPARRDVRILLLALGSALAPQLPLALPLSLALLILLTSYVILERVAFVRSQLAGQ